MVRAIGHRPDQSGNLTAVDPPSDDTRLWPAGYLAATPTGVGRLVTALLNEGRVEGRQVLPSGWVRRMTTPQVAVPGMFGGTGYGFGVFIDTLWGGPAIWHPGLIDGSTALFLGLPREHLGVVVLANRDGVRLEGLAREILALLYRSRGGTPTQPPPFTPPTVAEVPGSQFDALTGTYEGRFQIRVLRQADSLLLERFGSRAALHPLAGGQWLVGQATPERRELITIHVAHDKVPTFIQMGLWAFVRRDSTSSGH
jgi:CubicO group peptidase (beta-lactamase class C family)